MKTKTFSILLAAMLIFTVFGSAPTRASAQGTQFIDAAVAFPIAGTDMPLDIVGVTVVPHTYSGAIRQMTPTNPLNGALVQIYVKNRNSNPDDEADLLVPAEAAFNNNLPLNLINTGVWTWSDTPDQRPDWWESRMLPAQAIDVYTINVRDPKFWGGDSIRSFKMLLADWNVGYVEEYTVPVPKPDLFVSRIAFTSSVDSFTPDGLNVYLTNKTRTSWSISNVNVWVPSNHLGETHAWENAYSATSIVPFAANGQIPIGATGGARVSFDPLPLTKVIVEVQVTNGRQTRTLFNTVRSYVSVFDIGAGWLNGSENGVQPLTSEPFLKTMSLIHLNTAHIPEVAGYTDTARYTQYPLKLFWPLNDPKYSDDAWLPFIHGNEQLGEPQCAICPGHRTPQEVSVALRSFTGDRFPMTLTLSDEPTFRYYAGLSDFPHFDAYRVTAPSGDIWEKYSSRWGGQVIGWGAPLETIGSMVRTNNAVNMPKPTAVWSQGVSMGWRWDEYDGRERKSPTPLEIRLQNYEALANGVTSVYWYALEAQALVCYRDTIHEFRDEGRVMNMLGPLLAEGAPYSWTRRTRNYQPSLDLNVVAGPDYAVLFAIDLSYYPDMTEKVFVNNGPRSIRESFSIPTYLGTSYSVFKVDANGVHDVTFSAYGRNLIITDTIDAAGVYIVTSNASLRNQIDAKYQQLIAAEQALGFDPFASDADLEALYTSLGYSSVEEACQ